MAGYVIKTSNDEVLAHHGIMGMKWGKRNGPPYPLDGEDHSAAEKKAGTSGWTKEAKKETGSQYTSLATKRAKKRKAFGEKMDAKSAARYERKTGEKYIEDDEDRMIRTYNDRRISANEEIDSKVRNIRNNQAKGAKVAKYMLYGPIGASAYDNLRAMGYSKGKAYVTEVLFGDLGAMVIASNKRKKAVNAELDSL